MNRQQFAVICLGALMLAPIAAAPIMRQPAAPTELDFDPTHRLVGLGCGPDRLTFTANEEDHFPAPCYAIGTPAELCPDDPTLPPEPVDAAECAAYMGRSGW